MKNSALTLFLTSAHHIHTSGVRYLMGISNKLQINSDLMLQHTITKWLNYWHYLLCIFTFLSWRCQLERNVNELKNRQLQDWKLAYCPTWSQVSTLSFWFVLYVWGGGVLVFFHEIVLVSWILDTLTRMCKSRSAFIFPFIPILLV